MAMSSSPLSYADCYEIFDRALASDKGVKISFTVESDAIHLKNRLHYARKIHRKQNEETYETDHPLHGASEYDELVVKLRHNGAKHFLLVEKSKMDMQIEEIE